MLKSLELFAGAGGLALGMSRAGISHRAMLELNEDACRTIARNAHLISHPESPFQVIHGDARRAKYASFAGTTDIVSGGPPCQPFSLAGKHRAHSDGRDMFPEAVRAVRELKPKAFIFENVKGLLRKTFTTYLEYILLQLSFPNIQKKEKETWIDHLKRLERIQSSGSPSHEYHVLFRLLNAADYGVAQKRERVFIVGFRSDMEVEWSFPDATHSSMELTRQKWITGEYWERHSVAQKDRPEMDDRMKSRVERLRQSIDPHDDTMPWMTVRDALVGLPDPRATAAVNFKNHNFNPGARVYKGHTGSPLDEPAKTLKAGAHGVPGGENMLVNTDGSVRYFTIREAARLQGFPDEFEFEGAWSEAMRQLGNAVPVDLAECVARSIAEKLY